MVGGIHPPASLGERAGELQVGHGLRREGALLGRLCLAFIFILSGLSKATDFAGTAEHMTSEGLPAVSLLLTAAIVVEVMGGVALAVGLWTRLAALLLFLYLVPVTLVFHDFWRFGGVERLNQTVHFLKNLAILGGLLVTACGARGYSVDSLVARPTVSGRGPAVTAE